MNLYTVNEQRIYAQEAGSFQNQVALLLHGWSSSSYALSPLMPRLSKRFHCIAVDLPGYGQSPACTQPATMTGYADLLAGLIRQVSDDPVVLVGHSMGGMISLTLALHYPELVERMVLLCPTISGHLSTSINLFVSPITMLERFTLANKLVAWLEPHFLNVTDRLMRPVSFAARSQIMEEDYIHLRSDARRPGQGRVRAECFRAMRTGDLRGRLSQIATPALVLWGAEDNTVPLRDASVVADEWSAADLRIIPRAGHWPQFETPEATHRHIAAFLGLPLSSGQTDAPDSQEVTQINQMARFLAHSDIGNGLNLAQRMRLAAQCRVRSYPAQATIVQANDAGDTLFVIQDGSIEVWSHPNGTSQPDEQTEQLAMLLPGQITGELSLLDGGRRTAHLRAGSEGATLLWITRERLVRLCEDDPILGNRLLWNIAAALALRLRLNYWQQYMEERDNTEPLQEKVLA